MKVFEAVAALFAPIKGLAAKLKNYVMTTSSVILKADMALVQQYLALAPKMLMGQFNPQDLVAIYTNYAKAVEGAAAGAIKPLVG